MKYFRPEAFYYVSESTLINAIRFFFSFTILLQLNCDDHLSPNLHGLVICIRNVYIHKVRILGLWHFTKSVRCLSTVLYINPGEPFRVVSLSIASFLLSWQARSGDGIDDGFETTGLHYTQISLIAAARLGWALAGNCCRISERRKHGIWMDLW